MRMVTLALVMVVALGLALWVARSGTAAAPPADKAKAAEDNNAFAFDLYGKLREQDGNLFFSPESISTALAMTYAGARGETAEQMAAALHFSLGPDRLHPAFAALLHDLQADTKTKGYQLHLANALWAQKGDSFLPAYLQLVHDNYGAGLEEVDFAHAAEQARQTINAWVAKQTADKIPELFGPGILKPGVSLVLTNAVYFKGDWQSPFKAKATHGAPFHLSDGGKVTVRLMEQTGRFGYLDGDTFQALELPYAGKDLSMVVLLPKKGHGLDELEKRLTAATARKIFANLGPDEVLVGLPKFKVTSQFDLGGALAALGMKQAFSTDADFSGMDGRHDLFLSKVIHKAYVDVNEKGTEAAAATGVVMERAAVRKRPVFVADRPFVFLIRDTRSGSILFLGRVQNPQA
jgi:serpin B